jgi:hypothetical protein
MSDIVERLRENIERVEWTLKDAEWKPSRAYLEKLLATYKEAADEIERLRRDKLHLEHQMALGDQEIDRLRSDLAQGHWLPWIF